MKLIAVIFQLIAVLSLAFPLQAQNVFHRRASFRSVSPITLIDVGAATYVASGSITPALPTTYAEGDVLVAFFGTRTGSGFSTPGDWTFWFSFTSSSAVRIQVSYKIATASESAPTFSGATTDTAFGQIAAFRNVGAAVVGATGTGAYDATTSTTEYGAAPAAAGVPDGGGVIVFAMGNNDATGSQTLLTGDDLTWETIGEGSSTLGGDISFAWQFGTKAGAITMTDKTISRAMTASVSGAGQIALTP